MARTRRASLEEDVLLEELCVALVNIVLTKKESKCIA